MQPGDDPRALFSWFGFEFALLVRQGLYSGAQAGLELNLQLSILTPFLSL